MSESSHGPPPQIKELAEKRGYTLRRPIGRGKPWLLLCRAPDPELSSQDLELSSKLEKIPFSPFIPDYDFPPRPINYRRGEYIYLPYYPSLYLGLGTRALSGAFEGDRKEEKKLYSEACDYYTGDDGLVRRERLSDLIAERGDLQQQIEREGEPLKVLLRDVRALLEVLHLEYKRAVNPEGATAKTWLLTAAMRDLYIWFYQGGQDEVEAHYTNIRPHLQDAGVPGFLIRHQWDGIEDLRDARDVIIAPMSYMNKKRKICERLLNAARLDKPAPTSDEFTEEQARERFGVAYDHTMAVGELLFKQKRDHGQYPGEGQWIKGEFTKWAAGVAGISESTVYKAISKTGCWVDNPKQGDSSGVKEIMKKTEAFYRRFKG